MHRTPQQIGEAERKIYINKCDGENYTVSNKLNIKLTIAGKSFPLSIERENEEKYRRAEAEINDLVTEFRTRFRAPDEDYLAMAALQIALANVEMEMSRSLGDEIDSLVEIDRRLDDYLNSIR